MTIFLHDSSGECDELFALLLALIFIVGSEPSSAPEATIVAKSIMSPPIFSLGDRSSPRSSQAQSPAHIGSLERIILASDADSVAWPFCWRTPASAPEPTAENNSKPQARRSRHPNHMLCSDSPRPCIPPAETVAVMCRINPATKYHATYIKARMAQVAL